MSSNPPPPPKPTDDWQLPDQESPSGNWESEDIRPAARQAQTASDWLKPITQALRGPFGSLWDDPRSRPLILVTLLALVGVCALSCFILSVALLSNPSLPGPVGPTVVAEPTKPITASLIINVNQTPIPPGVPERLTIANTTYRIVPLQLDDKGQWQYDRNAQKTAFWAAGTLVNVVIGLPATNDNRAMFQSLSSNDLLVLDTAVGELRYRVAHTETVKVDDQAPFLDQVNPQMTLVMLGENGDQRRLVIAPYTDEGTANALTSIGVPINLGDARVKVLSSRLIPGSTVNLAGSNYYQVAIQVTNVVTRILDAAQFFSMLVDGAGNKYAISSDASFASGGSGWSQGALLPGMSITATAGFEVPNTMPGPRLEWTFTTEQSNPYIARVSIPYQPIAVAPTTQPTTVPIAEVTILNASLSPEGNELRIVGTVHNLTSQFLPVSLRDVSLATGNSLSALNSSLPAFPWSITAGETLAFQLTFVRPPGGSPATFTMFGQSFEISGL